jgi:hypothetical protein
LVRVSATSVTGSPDFKKIAVTCPANTTLLGGGADVIGGGNSVFIYMLVPNPEFEPPNTFLAGAGEDAAGYAGAWSITVYAICGTGVTGYSIATASTLMPPGQKQGTATAVCPAGKKVVGGGGSTYKSRAVLDTVTTNHGASWVVAESFRNEADPGNASVGVNAYAICINPVPGMQWVSSSSGSVPGDKLVSVNCPAGTKVHGALASLVGADGQAHIDALVPYAALNGVLLNAREDATGHPGSWSASVHAICAT